MGKALSSEAVAQPLPEVVQAVVGIAPVRCPGRWRQDGAQAGQRLVQVGEPGVVPGMDPGVRAGQARQERGTIAALTSHAAFAAKRSRLQDQPGPDQLAEHRALAGQPQPARLVPRPLQQRVQQPVVHQLPQRPPRRLCNAPPDVSPPPAGTAMSPLIVRFMIVLPPKNLGVPARRAGSPPGSARPCRDRFATAVARQ